MHAQHGKYKSEQGTSNGWTTSALAVASSPVRGTAEAGICMQPSRSSFVTRTHESNEHSAASSSATILTLLWL